MYVTQIRKRTHVKFATRLVSGLVASVALSAFAVPGAVKVADTNGDRALNRTEACAGRTSNVCRNFARIDVNRDGVVTRSEIRAFSNARRIARGLPPKH
jgi:hypothetical protein